MKKNQNFSKEERQALKKFLARYYKAKKQEALLQERLLRMRSEFTDRKKASEIETRIRTQIKEAKKSTTEIMAILELLPQGSTERVIMELRHLDCKSWTQIQRTVHLTSSPCYERYNKGLDLLLKKAKVRKMIGLSKKDIGG